MDIQEEINEDINVEEGSYVKSYQLVKPHLGMKFDSEDEAYYFYNKYAATVGFSIRQSKAHKSRITGNIINRKLVCSKEGHKDLKQSMGRTFKHKREFRENCLAHLYIGLRHDNKWEVRKFHEEHSHPLTIPSKISILPQKQPMSEAFEEVIERPHISGMGSSNTVQAEPHITTQGCTDYLKRKRTRTLDKKCLDVINYFQNKATDDPGFFHRWELNENGAVMNFFWADGRARDNFITFGDVVVFSITYMTNYLRMPFASFTGINHHRKSCLFGCALLADETEETFIWLFEKWLECMNEKYPICIITNQYVAVGNVISKVFPHTKHILCTWHIERSATIQLQDLYAQGTFKQDYDKWLYESTSVHEFEERWLSLKQKYDISDEHWIEEMYNKRTQWVPLYLTHIFTAGMNTTQRAKSVSAFFDGFVNANTSFIDFVQQYDNAIESHRGIEEREDFFTMNKKPVLVSKHPLEEHASKIYTKNVFCKFQDEIEQVSAIYAHKISKDDVSVCYSVYPLRDVDKGKNIVELSRNNKISIRCSCKKFEQEGIFCCHVLNVLAKKGVVNLPEEYILHRWTIDARYSQPKQFDTTSIFEDDITPLQRSIWQSNIWRVEKFGLISGRHLKFGAPIVDEVLKKFAAFDLTDVVAGQASQPAVTNVASTSTDLHESQFVIRDPTPAKSNGRPRNVGIRSLLRKITSPNESKKTSCRECGKKGHDEGNCPILKHNHLGSEKNL